MRVPGGEITPQGIRSNVTVGIEYLESWLRGVGAAAINNLMEDAATAEIARSQVWQWIRRDRVERAVVRSIADEVVAEAGEGRWQEARALFDAVALSDDFAEFLTIPAYDYLD